MACPTSKTLGGKKRPLHRELESSCSYIIEESSKSSAVAAVAQASAMPGYLRRSRFYRLPNGVRVYVYFRRS